MITKTQTVIELPTTKRSSTNNTHTISIRIATPTSGDPKNVAILAGGLGVPAGYYTPFMETLTRHGWGAIIADPPGQGDSKPNLKQHQNYGYHYLATTLIPLLVHTARHHLNPQHLTYLGHSVGGHWLLTHLAHHRPDLTDPDFAGIALIASGSAHWRHYNTTTGIQNLLRARAATLISNNLGLFPGDSLGLGARQPAQIMADWATMTQDGILPGVELAEVDSLRRFVGPVLAVDCAGDRVSPAASVDALLDFIPQATVTRQHLATPRGHVRWAREPDSAVDALISWSEQSASAQALAPAAEAGWQDSNEPHGSNELDLVTDISKPASRTVRPEDHVIRLDEARLPKQTTGRKLTRLR